MKKILQGCFRLMAWVEPIGSITGFMTMPRYAAAAPALSPMFWLYLILGISSGAALMVMALYGRRLDWQFSVYDALKTHSPFECSKLFCVPKLLSIIAGIVILAIEWCADGSCRWLITAFCILDLILLLVVGVIGLYLWLWLHLYGDGYITYVVSGSGLDGKSITITDTCKISELRINWLGAKIKMGNS